MEYFLALIVGLTVLVVILTAAAKGKSRPVGRTGSGGDVTPNEPAANDPTPGASTTASNRVAENAQKHTPPA